MAFLHKRVPFVDKSERAQTLLNFVHFNADPIRRGGKEGRLPWARNSQRGPTSQFFKTFFEVCLVFSFLDSDNSKNYLQANKFYLIFFHRERWPKYFYLGLVLALSSPIRAC